ncbi:MAG: hypothetical protein NTW17_02530 [Candidatus Pacearchaeota archaeon]|nr:hypothetical protein [Candidatus Pacearchaeota archaeon]
MAGETILQHWIVTKFALPFLLIFFILFGVLEKTEIFGKGKAKLNALIAFVVGLIFVGAVFPKLVVENLTLFLTIAIVVVFIALLLWGFIVGETPKVPGKLQGLVAGVVIIAVIIALLWAMGVEGTFFDLLFRQSWSSDFWTNAAFIVVIIIALTLVVKGSKSS